MADNYFIAINCIEKIVIYLNLHHNFKKMKLYSKQDAIEQMNRLAKADIPYIFIIDYLQENIFIERIENVDPYETLFSFNSVSNSIHSINKKREDIGLLQIGKNFSYNKDTDVSNIEWHYNMPLFNSYKMSFDTVVSNIRRGNSFLVNLTCKVPIATNLSLVDIFYNSKAMYKLLLKDRFVCFSPEIFVRIDKNGVISSYPMKGTIEASVDRAEEILMNDEKEAAEHATIVDLIRNDLSMVAEDVKVDKYRYVDTIYTNKGPILQTSSKISGHLPDDYQERIGDIIFRLLPAGSITGAPKKKTMEIIAEAEGYNRNFYTGIMGYYMEGCLDSGVMIRFIENEDGKLYFKAGGGITSMSCCESEYNEVIQKVYVPIY